MFLRSVTLSAAAYVVASKGDLGCLDGQGKPADFWYSFKFSDGWDYAFMAKGKALSKAADQLNKDTSTVSRTLAQLYAGYKGMTYAMWNDEHFDGKKVETPYAHAKGVVAFDGTRGFWLTHSLPQFPGDVKTGNPSYGTASDKFGQSYLCITIDKTAFQEINKLAMVNRYTVYDAADNAKMGSDFTDWAISGKHGSDLTLVTTVKSMGGQAWTVFAKSASWDDELYMNLVAKHFNTDLFTETWQNGKGKIVSWCKGPQYLHTVENVEEVKYPGKEFSETSDHSKWAVSAPGPADQFCVGDINRQEGQFKRGGGTLCIEGKEFADQMRKVITKREKCGSAEAENLLLM